MRFEDDDGDASVAARLAARRRVPAWIWALVAFVLGIGLTFWLAEGEKQRNERDDQRAFITETEQVTTAIRLQLDQSGQIIRAFQSIFMASDSVTPDEYNLAYDNMRAGNAVQVSLQALAYVERRHSPAGDHYVTTMFAPRNGNESILGLDVASQPINMEALARARDTGQIAMSAAFHLRQDGAAPRAPNGFILRLPVFAQGWPQDSTEARRLASIGSIGASFRISDLIASTLPQPPSTLADVAVEDVSSGRPQLLYSQRFGARSEASPFSTELRFGGRTWNVIAHPSENRTGMSGWLLVVLVGTAMSALLAALAWSSVSTRERAIALGNFMGKRFRTSEERFRKLNELLPTLVLLARKDDGEIVYRNASARNRLFAEGKWTDFSATLEEEIQATPPVAAASEEALRAVDVQLPGADGTPFWASTWISSVEIDETPMWLMVASDISEQRRLTETLSYQASHDSLTKLYNRREFETRAQRMLEGPGSHEGALLFIDLDQFKLINDTSGHRAGDELLVQLSSVMREKLRPNDVLGRLGGDEFGVLLAGASTVESSMHAAERLRRAIEGFTFSWEQRTYMISASIGLVLLSSAASLKELFAHADSACYLAKEAGRNRIHVYAEDDAAITGRIGEMEWAGRIRDALRDKRMLLDYQELHSLRPLIETGASVELLLRLRSEDGSVVLPGAFLPAAERYGLMPLIDRWVVETALANIDRIHPDGKRLATCAINLSGASLEDDGLFERVKQLVNLHRIDPGRVMFEITETVAVRNFAASSALIARLRALGCRVALDDFGAGMSSFGYLKNLELDVVKIDGSFVQSMATDRMSRSIVKAVAEIGHEQGLEVVAEWVSSVDMLEILAGMNIDYAQGFALHCPERVLFQRKADE
ncbi:MAG: bifunctional diguanylate cyclase/phosphodiesterase [Thermomonas sp.]